MRKAVEDIGGKVGEGEGTDRARVEEIAKKIELAEVQVYKWM